MNVFRSPARNYELFVTRAFLTLDMFVREYKGASLSILFARYVMAFMTESSKCSDSFLSGLPFLFAQSKASLELCWFWSVGLMIFINWKNVEWKDGPSTTYGLLFRFMWNVQKAKGRIFTFLLSSHSTYDRHLEKQLFFSFHLLSLNCVLFTAKKNEHVDHQREISLGKSSSFLCFFFFDFILAISAAAH